VEQAKSAEAQEAKIALETKNPEILEAYLQKNSASPQRSELLRAMSSLLRSEHDEWTIFGWALPKNLPAYLKINSIEQFGDSVAAEMEWVFDPSSTDHPPENSYQISREVFSCNEQIVRIAENTIFDKQDHVLWHYKWADPNFLETVVDPTSIPPGSVFYFVRNILCDEELRTPLVRKQELLATKFASLSSMSAGDGELFYKVYGNSPKNEENQIVVIARYNKSTNLKEIPLFANLDATADFRTAATLAEMDCSQKRSFTRKVEFYDASGALVAIVAEDRAKVKTWAEIADKSPIGLLRRIVCHESESVK